MTPTDVPNPSNAPFHDNMAVEIDRVLKAAPTLKQHPDLVVAIAKQGGDVESNAQMVGALQLVHAVAQSVHQHAQENPAMYSSLIRSMQAEHGRRQ